MRDTAAGFTLMETIVALVVFAGVVVALERGTATGWRGIRLTHGDAGALAIARDRLAAAGGDGLVPEDGEVSGEAPPYTWRVAIRRYVAPEGVTLPPRPAGYWVRVSVWWRDRPTGPLRLVELETLKLGRPP